MQHPLTSPSHSQHSLAAVSMLRPAPSVPMRISSRRTAEVRSMERTGSQQPPVVFSLQNRER